MRQLVELVARLQSYVIPVQSSEIFELGSTAYYEDLGTKTLPAVAVSQAPGHTMTFTLRFNLLYV